MTKEQINFIIDQYGGKEKFVGDCIYEIFFDNPRTFMQDSNTTREQRLENLVFDDVNEMVIIKEPNKIYEVLRDYTPTKSTIYIPYDNVQGIHVLNGTTFDITKNKNGVSED